MPLLAAPTSSIPNPRVVFRAGTQRDVLTVTRQDLGGSASVWTEPREIARIPGVQGEGQGGTIPSMPRVSPDGTRLAVQTGIDRRTVPAKPVRLGGRMVSTTQEVGGSHLLLVLDTKTGRVLSRSRFDGQLSYAWSATSRTLGVVAQSRDYQLSSVYAIKEGGSRQLVRRGATTLLWSGDALLTASWSKHGQPVHYGEMFQAFGSRWGGYVPLIRRHARGRVSTLSLRAAEREIGTFGLGARLWSPSPGLIGLPIKNPRERGLLIEGGDELVTSLLDTVQPRDADGNKIIAMSVGPTRSLDSIFFGGKRYRIGHPGEKMGDGGRGRSRSWNLGSGCVAYVSNAGVFGNDEDRGELAAIDLRTRRKRYWSGLNLSEYADYDIFWR